MGTPSYMIWHIYVLPYICYGNIYGNIIYNHIRLYIYNHIHILLQKAYTITTTLRNLWQYLPKLTMPISDDTAILL